MGRERVTNEKLVVDTINILADLSWYHCLAINSKNLKLLEHWLEKEKCQQPFEIFRSCHSSKSEVPLLKIMAAVRIKKQEIASLWGMPSHLDYQYSFLMLPVPWSHTIWIRSLNHRYRCQTQYNPWNLRYLGPDSTRSIAQSGSRYPHCSHPLLQYDTDTTATINQSQCVQSIKC